MAPRYLNSTVKSPERPSKRRAMLGLPPSIVIVPELLAEPTQKLLDAYGALDGNTLPCSIVPLAPGKPPKYPLLLRNHAVMGGLLTSRFCYFLHTSNALRRICDELALCRSEINSFLQDRNLCCQTIIL